MSAIGESAVRMANDIARNCAVGRSKEEGAQLAAEHIMKYWEPRMIDALRDEGNQKLSPMAREAVAKLAPLAGQG